MKLTVNIVALLLLLATLIAIGYGYIHNIIMLVGSASFGLLEVVRAIGIVAPPLGVIMGFVG